MKFTLSLILLFTSLAAFSQNSFFIPFGQDTTEVQTYLDSKDYLINTQVVSEDLIKSTVGDSEIVNYSFKSGKLYAIENKRLFVDRKKAQEIAKGGLKYLEMLGEVYMAIDTKDIKHYVSVKDDKIIELIISPGDRPFKLEVHLKSTSRNHGPRMKTEAFVASVTAAE